MLRDNDEVAAAFEELADLTEMTGGDYFRVLAYRRVAETVEGLAADVARMSEKELTALRGVGKGTAAKIGELLQTGTFQKLEELRALVPAGVREMTALPGVGPKKAMLLHRELGISTLAELREAIEARRLRAVKGLGEKTEENLLRALERRVSLEEKRILLSTALETAEEMLGSLKQVKGVRRLSYAGSLRRMRETIGDIDLLAAAPDAGRVMDAFGSLSNVERVAARGPTKSTVITASSLQVDLRVVAPDEWGAALQYFTGSKDHNVKVREHAVKLGFKLSEYGLFRVEGGERVAAATEEEVYAALGMQTPPPTMREDKGEVELALRGELPAVVQVREVKGDLHAHSTYSDGDASIKEMVAAAAKLGYKYLAITDHGDAGWPLLDNLARQAKEVRALNRSLKGQMTILQGVEVSIGPEGRFDLPDEVLASFDLVIASIHEPPSDRAEVTRRLLRAVEHREVNVIGHPTGRSIGKDPPMEFDLEAVFKAAARNDVAMEVSADPERLDLRDEHIRVARGCGCVFAINTDAHAPDWLGRMRLGVFTAQRGWVGKEEVINAWPLAKLRRFLEKRG